MLGSTGGRVREKMDGGVRRGYSKGSHMDEGGRNFLLVPRETLTKRGHVPEKAVNDPVN